MINLAVSLLYLTGRDTGGKGMGVLWAAEFLATSWAGQEGRQKAGCLVKWGHSGCGPVSQVQSFLLPAKSQEVSQCCSGDSGQGARPKEPAENVPGEFPGHSSRDPKGGHPRWVMLTEQDRWSWPGKRSAESQLLQSDIARVFGAGATMCPLIALLQIKSHDWPT